MTHSDLRDTSLRSFQNSPHVLIYLAGGTHSSNLMGESELLDLDPDRFWQGDAVPSAARPQLEQVAVWTEQRLWSCTFGRRDEQLLPLPHLLRPSLLGPHPASLECGPSDSQRSLVRGSPVLSVATELCDY